MPKQKTHLRTPLQTFGAFILKGGRNGVMFYVIHGVVGLMATWQVVFPDQSHWSIWLLLSVVLLGLWAFTVANYVGMCVGEYEREMGHYLAPNGWHSWNEQDYYNGPVQWSEVPDTGMDAVKAPWMDRAYILPKGYGRESAAIANRAWHEGQKHGKQ